MTDALNPSLGAPMDWTAGRMAFQLSQTMENYVVARSSGYDEFAAALASETGALGEPAVMMIAKEQFALLRFLCGLLVCRRALDVGTFTGMSALAMAAGMGRGGQVVSIDRTAAWLEIARRHWTAAGVVERIDARTGEAIDMLRSLRDTAAAPFDIAFIDVDKARVREYFEITLELLAPHGIIIIDNAAWHGWVLDDEQSDADTEGMRRFNLDIANDSRVEALIVPVADGMNVIRRR